MNKYRICICATDTICITYITVIIRAVWSVSLLISSATIARAEVAGVPQDNTNPPNIVLLLADDLGYTDIGSFGSEISTPNLDALAARGVRFSNYHTAASCAPTRAMLMSGLSSHQAGLGNMPESLASDTPKTPAYSGHLILGLPTVANQLSDAGYRTYMAGKWHLGATPDTLPSARGFDRTYALADTGADNWEQRPYLPIYDQANWFEDGARTTLPDDFYSSKDLIDKTIEYIDTDSEAPFFAYVAFQAVHIPVQAPKRYTQKYLETYQQGWSHLRQQRYEGAIQQGIVPAGLPLEAMHTTQDWDALSDSEQAYEARSMAVYAGMIESMDANIGRLIQHLKATDRYDNTLFIFTSDNGAEPSDTMSTTTPTLARKYFEYWLNQTGYTTDIETLGEKGSYNMIGASFASAAVSPLSYYKFFNGEGGMRVPLVIAPPLIDANINNENNGGNNNKNKPPKLTNAFTYVTDLVPTILEVSGATPINGAEGKSLIPIITGESQNVRGESDSVGFELGGNATFFQGDYKIVLNRGPIGDDQWHMYNIQDDPTEQLDLVGVEPQRFESMRAGYNAFTKKHGVLTMPQGYDQRTQIGKNLASKTIKSAIPYLAAFILLSVVVMFFRRRNRARVNV